MPIIPFDSALNLILSYLSFKLADQVTTPESVVENLKFLMPPEIDKPNANVDDNSGKLTNPKKKINIDISQLSKMAIKVNKIKKDLAQTLNHYQEFIRIHFYLTGLFACASGSFIAKVMIKLFAPNNQYFTISGTFVTFLSFFTLFLHFLEQSSVENLLPFLSSKNRKNRSIFSPKTGRGLFFILTMIFSTILFFILVIPFSDNSDNFNSSENQAFFGIQYEYCYKIFCKMASNFWKEKVVDAVDSIDSNENSTAKQSIEKIGSFFSEKAKKGTLFVAFSTIIFILCVFLLLFSYIASVRTVKLHFIVARYPLFKILTKDWKLKNWYPHISLLNLILPILYSLIWLGPFQQILFAIFRVIFQNSGSEKDIFDTFALCLLVMMFFTRILMIRFQFSIFFLLNEISFHANYLFNFQGRIFKHICHHHEDMFWKILKRIWKFQKSHPNRNFSNSLRNHTSSISKSC